MILDVRELDLTIVLTSLQPNDGDFMDARRVRLDTGVYSSVRSLCQSSGDHGKHGVPYSYLELSS